MKKLSLLFLWLILVFNAGAQFPPISLYDTHNNQFEISDLQGENLTVVDFWATWCKPCLLAIPELVKIQDDFASQGVRIVGVNIDSPRNKSKIKPFASSRSINYTILLDPDQEMMSELNVIYVPTLIIFDNVGNQVFVHEGFTAGDQVLIRQEIEKILKYNVQ